MKRHERNKSRNELFKEPKESSFGVSDPSSSHGDSRSAQEIGLSVLEKQKSKTKKRSTTDASDFIFNENLDQSTKKSKKSKK